MGTHPSVPMRGQVELNVGHSTLHLLLVQVECPWLRDFAQLDWSSLRRGEAWGGPIYLVKTLEKSCCEEVVIDNMDTMGLLPATKGQQII